MTEALTFTPHRTISSVMILAVTLVIAASMALGFGIRTWTEQSTHSSTPAAVQAVQPVTPPAAPSGSTTNSQPMLGLTGPR